MTPGRVATLIVMMLIPSALWGYLNHVKSDMLMHTRFVIRQVSRADAEGDERSWHRFYTRYRFPEGSPQRQEMLFEELWDLFRGLRPESVTYGSRERLRTEDGRERNCRQVLVRGRDRDGEPMALSLDWVQYRGSWYLQDYRDEVRASE
jgi:hypothetical protein